jgi:quercetin dioxygenase-like cupin family protein
MKVLRPHADTIVCPPEWGTGEIYIDPIHTPDPPNSLFQCGSSHFAPAARTVWHTHPLGQTLLVLDGLGVVQSRGEPAQVVYPGDRVFFAPDEEHWHGAAPHRFMTHLTMSQVDAQGVGVSWLEPVADDDYQAAAQACLTSKENE